ncbi:MAG: hypothetical protein PF572_03645 [Patescibacteria group bacterium]|jgi:multiple antibiotic resistance protein|nr:hypothetical protein [Patescibacteria group bacterium]
MTSVIIEFLVLLNPFALFLYLLPVMKDLDNKTFRRVMVKASLISFSIYFTFMIGGDFIMNTVFRIHMESFRIFGGIIIFAFAYIFIVKGGKAMIKLRGNIDELASEIALPFMVGAGTLSLAILLGHSKGPLTGGLTLLLTMLINFIIIMSLKIFRDNITRKKIRMVFDHNMEIFLRLNGFFVGAIGVNMVKQGIENILK